MDTFVFEHSSLIYMSQNELQVAKKLHRLHSLRQIQIFFSYLQSFSLYEIVTNVSVIYFYYYKQYLEHIIIASKGLLCT